MEKPYILHKIGKNDIDNIYRKLGDRKNCVYLYLNPLKQCHLNIDLLGLDIFLEPFYVGSGTKERYKIHIWYSKKGEHFNKGFQEIYDDIIVNKMRPVILILRDNLTKKEAERLEKYVINEINKNIKLVNKKKGDYDKKVFPRRPF